MTSTPMMTSVLRRAMAALIAAGVVSIALGILGMHALSTHGVLSSTNHATMTMPATGTAAGAAHAELSVDPATHDPAGVAAAVAAASSSGSNGHDMDSMVMLCVAVLAAAAGAVMLLLLGLRRSPRVWVHAPTVPGTVPRWVTALPGTGPPSVWEFSVIRC